MATYKTTIGSQYPALQSGVEVMPGGFRHILHLDWDVKLIAVDNLRVNLQVPLGENWIILYLELLTDAAFAEWFIDRFRFRQVNAVVPDTFAGDGTKSDVRLVHELAIATNLMVAVRAGGDLGDDRAGSWSELLDATLNERDELRIQAVNGAGGAPMGVTLALEVIRFGLQTSRGDRRQPEILEAP